MDPRPSDHRRSPANARRLTLADLMLLIGATALGLGTSQAAVPAFLGATATPVALLAPGEPWTPSVTLKRAIGVVVLLLSVFGPWTFLLPVLRLRPPRPRRRRLSDQPGLTACVAAIVGMVLGAVGTCLGHLARASGASPLGQRGTLGQWMRVIYLNDLIGYAGLAVVSVWSVQAITGRWRPAPDAVDRLGRFIGLLWVVAGLVWAVRHYAFLL
jgi:hypothetical protein